MRILHTSDWHVGKTLRGESRLDEHRVVLAEIVDIARTEQADIALVTGDLFESAAPPPEAKALVFETLLALHATGAKVIEFGTGQMLSPDEPKVKFNQHRHGVVRAVAQPRRSIRARRLSWFGR